MEIALYVLRGYALGNSARLSQSATSPKRLPNHRGEPERCVDEYDQTSVRLRVMSNDLYKIRNKWPYRVRYSEVEKAKQPGSQTLSSQYYMYM